MKFGFLLSWFVSFAIWATPPTPRAVAGKTPVAPEIDGVIEVAEWESAAVLSNFVDLSFAGMAAVETRGMVCWDATTLYVAVHCDEPSMKSLRTFCKKRDERVWRDDCIEIFIDGNFDRKTCHHILVNAIGTVYDHDNPGNAKWNANARVATTKGKDFWTLEIAIPFADLGIVPKAGMTIGFNLGRERKAGESSPLTAWSATLGKFMVPQRFGELVLKERAEKVGITVPPFAFGPNRVVANCREKPEIVITRNWPAGLKRNWELPEPEIEKRGEGGWNLDFRLVDGSATTITIKVGDAYRQAFPVYFTPIAKIGDLARSIIGFRKNVPEATPFAARMRETIEQAQHRLDALVAENIKRTTPMPQDDWEQAAGVFNRLNREMAGSTYILWSKDPLLDLGEKEYPSTSTPSPTARFSACANEVAAATMVITNVGGKTLDGRIEMKDLTLTNIVDMEGARSTELIKNGEFDQDDDKNGIPDHWTLRPKVRNASHLERLAGENVFVVTGGEAEFASNYRQVVPLKPETWYTLEAEISTVNIAPEKAGVFVINNGWTWSTAVKANKKNALRQHYTHTFRTLPEDQASFYEVVLHCHQHGTLGLVRYHHLSLREGRNGEVGLAADALSLHEVSWQDLRIGRRVADALPVMGQARQLSIPPGESRQVWIRVDTSELPPGNYHSSLRFVPRDHNLPAKTFFLAFKVLPVRLPDTSPIAVFNWDYAKNEQEVRDLADHLTNSFLVTTHFPIRFNKDGSQKGEANWDEYDKNLRRKLRHARGNGGIILFSYGIIRDFHRSFGTRNGWIFMDESWRRAFKIWVLEFERHLRDDIGMDYDEYAVQLWDEATHGNAERTLQAGRYLRSFAPRIRCCMDGAQTPGEIRALDPVVDLWIPSQNTLYAHVQRKEIRELYHELMAKGEPVWTYTCGTDMKSLSPLDYYRLKEWRVWQLGLQGSCFWAYNSMRGDHWDDFDGEMADCGVVYGTETAPVTSRRWEASRDGREDYICLDMLRRADPRGSAAFLDHLVDKVIEHNHDPDFFAGSHRALLHRLEKVLAAKIPNFIRIPFLSGHTVSWKTDQPTAGIFFWRIAGTADWNRERISKFSKWHSVTIGRRRGKHNIEWYSLVWTAEGGSSAVTRGLNSKYWFRLE